MSQAVARVNAEMYYFGLAHSAYPQVRLAVLDRLVAWRRGDPKEWTQRMFKSYLRKL